MKFYKFLTLFSSIFFIFSTASANTRNPLKYSVLYWTWTHGPQIEYVSSTYSNQWRPRNIIMGIDNRGWRSEINAPFPHIITFKLEEEAKIDLLKFKNQYKKTTVPGSSVREVQIEFSTNNSDSSYIKVGTFILKEDENFQEFKIHQSRARWIRLKIKSNYGYPGYTELTRFEAWGAFELNILSLITNIIWIFGVSLILAAFSYHEFSSHHKGVSFGSVLNSWSFKRPFQLGLILVTIGICLSIKNPWFAGIIGGAAFLFLVFMLRKIKAKVFKI